MHEIISFRDRVAALRKRATVPFSLTRIDPRRLLPVEKAPSKLLELRHDRPIAREEAARLRPVAERTGLVDKWARKVRRAGKVRLFRLWKIFSKTRPEVPIAPLDAAMVARDAAHVRMLGERLAGARRARRP